MAQIDINGAKLDYNATDAMFIEKFENEFEKIQNDKTEFKKLSEAMKHQCSQVVNFFENLFGKGTADKIISNKNDLSECSDAFLSVATTIFKEIEAFGTEMDNKVKKYAPNRIARRQK